MKIISQIWKRLRFYSLIYFLSFLGISIFANFIHFLLQIDIPDGADIFTAVFVSVVETVINVYFIGQINTLLQKLEEKRPVWYAYLPERYRRYQGLLDINGWIPISLLCLLFFTYCGWFDSIVVIILYGFLDFAIRQNYIKKACNASNEQDRNRFLKVHKKIHVRREDLGYLLKRGYKDSDNRVSVVRLFTELFLLYWKGKVGKQTAKGTEDFDSVYENIYDITYACVDDVCGQTYDFVNFNNFMADFMEMLKSIMEDKGIYDKYVSETMLAAVIAFAFFEKDKLDQAQICRILDGKGILKDKEIADICLWCIEFLFQYNERRDSIKISIKPETLKLYTSNISFSDEKDINFHRFIWCVWTRRAERSLSDSVVNVEELIEYCREKKNGKGNNTVRKKPIKTRSIYILVKEIQLEQGMIL